MHFIQISEKLCRKCFLISHNKCREMFSQYYMHWDKMLMLLKFSYDGVLGELLDEHFYWIWMWWTIGDMLFPPNTYWVLYYIHASACCTQDISKNVSKICGDAFSGHWYWVEIEIHRSRRSSMAVSASLRRFLAKSTVLTLHSLIEYIGTNASLSSYRL